MSQPITLSSPFFVLSFGLLTTLSLVISTPQRRASKPTTGEQVYKKQCAACHGAKGEGSKAYLKPLAGTQSAGQLARFIAQTMPPGPKKCAVADAKKVATYIYDAFYSPLAQARNRPARIELSRLTVRQYRNAVADLLGSFRPSPVLDVPHGLQAEYYKGRDFRGNERVLERIDPEVHFDFKTASPIPDKIEPHQFAMRWRGSVIAPDTGEYEFIVRTEHAVSLWVNDLKKPLVDAWVKSGSETTFRASIYLLGGRAYPLRLEFSKAKQGVDDTKNEKSKPPLPASIRLEWRQPKRTEEPVPQRCLLSQSVPEAYVPANPFPPDDKSIGYERGNSVSKEWNDATTEAALDTANYVATHLAELSGVADNAQDRSTRVRAFCQQLLERAFRRPLAPELTKLYLDRQLQSTPDLETAVKRIVLLALKSPRFLYREAGSANPDAFDVASRLSFGMWDSLPDTELLRAAAAGELSTREQVLSQADRMAKNPRAWFKLRDFFLQWLKVDLVPDLAKNTKRYPEFNESAANDLRTALEVFLENTVWNERSDYRDLLTSDKLFLNGRLAKLYGVDLPADATFQSVALDPTERAGVLTHPYIMASFAYLDASSPIHRGVLIARNLLGRTLQPPPVAVAPIAADLHPKLTTRQRVILQTRPAACMSCHSMINPLGFTLEKFDAIGRLRAEEKEQAIDTKGSYQTRGGQKVTFKGARDLASFLAESDESHTAFVEKLFLHTVKQPLLAYGPKTLSNLQAAFKSQNFNIRKEMVEIVVLSALKR